MILLPDIETCAENLRQRGIGKAIAAIGCILHTHVDLLADIKI
jgi:hypothetical protein